MGYTFCFIFVVYLIDMGIIKKILLGSAFLFFITSFSTKQNDAVEEIHWYDWNEGFVKARNEGKIALIDTYTDWCHWCKVMDRNTYTNKNIIALINEHFIPIKFNPELDKKYLNGTDTITGRQLLGALSGGNPSGYPTTYFYLTKKNVMLSEAGYLDPEKFETLLKGVMAEHAK